MDKEILSNTLNNYYFFYNGESFLENDCGEKDVTVYHIVNQRLLSLRAKGLDLQYKIHSNKNLTFIELAFTVFPYWKTCNDKEFIDRVKKHYSDEITKKILGFRKKIKDKFENHFKTENKNYEISNYKGEKFTWLVRFDLKGASEVEIVTDIYNFINNTYPFLENTLKELGL